MIRRCGLARGAALAAACCIAAACALSAGCRPAPPPPAAGVDDARPHVDARVAAHRALARRLRAFPVVRAGSGAGEAARIDERVRLGAFWLARRDLHHFGDAFARDARTTLSTPGRAPAADTALHHLLGVVERELPAWRALAGYNASERMREDGGAEGRRLLPHYIVAVDALEAATLAYVAAVEATGGAAR